MVRTPRLVKFGQCYGAGAPRYARVVMRANGKKFLLLFSKRSVSYLRAQQSMKVSVTPQAASARRGRTGGGTGGASIPPGGVSAASSASRKVANLRSLSTFSPNTSYT